MTERKLSMVAEVYADEININKIAESYGFRKKFTWEEPLLLQKDQLVESCPGIDADALLYIFSFGVIVFINMGDAFREKFAASVRDAFVLEKNAQSRRFSDEYEVVISHDAQDVVLANHIAVIPTSKEAQYFVELAATVIAKSVALDKIESLMAGIEDKIEDMLDRLSQGNVRIQDQTLAGTTAEILRFEFTTISYIMILDRPDVTWEDSAASDFYDGMSELFELNDRYNIIKNKTEILNNIKDGFSSISFSNRGMKLEWAVIILIVIEVIIMLLELLK